jgi:hypothetical protein
MAKFIDNHVIDDVVRGYDDPPVVGDITRC